MDKTIALYMRLSDEDDNFPFGFLFVTCQENLTR